MIQRLLTPVLTITLAGAVAFAVTRWQAAPAEAATMNRLQDASWLAAELQLTPDQVAAVENLQAAYAKDLASCCEMQCNARFELGEAFFSDAFSPEMKAELLREMSEAQVKSDAATLEHIRAIHALLSPDQRKAYERLVQSCLCAACPTCKTHR